MKCCSLPLTGELVGDNQKTSLVLYRFFASPRMTEQKDKGETLFQCPLLDNFRSNIVIKGGIIHTAVLEELLLATLHLHQELLALLVLAIHTEHGTTIVFLCI